MFFPISMTLDPAFYRVLLFMYDKKTGEEFFIYERFSFIIYNRFNDCAF